MGVKKVYIEEKAYEFAWKEREKKINVKTFPTKQPGRQVAGFENKKPQLTWVSVLRILDLQDPILGVWLVDRFKALVRCVPKVEI